MKEKMVGPLGQILDDLSPSFSKLGFSRIEESQFGMTFGDGMRSVTIGTNPYDPMEITIGLIDSQGRKSAISPWQYVLEPDNKRERVEFANRFIEEHKLRNLTIAEMRVDPVVREYLQQALAFASDFLSRHFDEIFNPSADLWRRYLEASAATFARLGIKL